MTNPGVSQRFVAGFASALSEARASLGHSPWDEAGIAAAIRTAAAHTPTVELLIAFARAAADGANETPAAVLHANNRAWDSDGYPPCRVHGRRASRRTNGECGPCYADRTAVTEPQPLARQGKPPTPELRQQILTAIGLGGRS